MYVANAMMIFRTICQYPGITQADLPDKIYELHGVDFRTSLVCHPDMDGYRQRIIEDLHCVVERGGGLYFDTTVRPRSFDPILDKSLEYGIGLRREQFRSNPKCQ